MNCNDALALLSPALDDALDERDDALLRTHLAGCVTCRQRQAYLRAARNAFRLAAPSRTAWTRPAPRYSPVPTAAAAALTAAILILLLGLREQKVDVRVPPAVDQVYVETSAQTAEPPCYRAADCSIEVTPMP